jgi:gluconolactonase
MGLRQGGGIGLESWLFAYSHSRFVNCQSNSYLQRQKTKPVIMRKTLAAFILLAGCTATKEFKTVGSIERLDPALDQILAPDAKIEVIAEGYTWSEGPVWVPAGNMLLYSDVPENVVYKWTEEKGAEEYLRPSGFTGTETDSREKGSNGLLLNNKGQLVICQHGDRRLSTMNAELTGPKPEFTTIADNFGGKRFNSPNDVAQGKNGNYYITDPPYGLSEKMMDDPHKEIPFQGVYQIAADGKVRLLVDSISRPNGIALSPDNKYLYIANSDPERARWYRFVLGDTSIIAGSIFHQENGDAGDGLKVDSNGVLFASGGGGVLIISPEGKVLGRIVLPDGTSNTALSPDEKTLFVTNDSRVLRIRMRE